jgi:hypothetical protein
VNKSKNDILITRFKVLNEFWILPFLMIYLDFNATTPLAPEAKAAIIDAMV